MDPPMWLEDQSQVSPHHSLVSLQEPQAHLGMRTQPREAVAMDRDQREGWAMWSVVSNSISLQDWQGFEREPMHWMAGPRLGTEEATEGTRML